MKVFNILKSLKLSSEQKKMASNVTKTCKATALIMAKRIFCFLQKMVYKLLERVHMERFAPHVTWFLLLCFGISVLSKLPGFQVALSFVMGFLGNVIILAIVAIVMYKLYRFAVRCYAEAKEELAQSQQPKPQSEKSGSKKG